MLDQESLRTWFWRGVTSTSLFLTLSTSAGGSAGVVAAKLLLLTVCFLSWTCLLLAALARVFIQPRP